ncbi:MAG: glucosidase [Saprospiraceae bacterium]
MPTQEQQRLSEQYSNKKNWLKWGPYLSERQWGTVREDYSPDGEAWDYFPHEDARSRAYRWGEDGIAGISDDFCNLCFSVAMWNGEDRMIKERLFGLTGPQGSHGEDVKELYYYLDNTPTHSYQKHLYKYPQREFPYEALIAMNAQRAKQEGEFELLDTGIFNDNRYFDVVTEYAKADAEDICIKITVHNRGEEAAPIALLPTLWLRNLWDVKLIEQRPTISLKDDKKTYGSVAVEQEKIGQYYLYFQKAARNLFAENETNFAKLFNVENETELVKDSINDALINNDFSKFDHVNSGTKFSPFYNQEVAGGKSVEIRLRLCKKAKKSNPLTKDFERVFTDRLAEADAFYQSIAPKNANEDELRIQRQAFAGMLWTKQYYNIDIPRWLKGDPDKPAPPPQRKNGRNRHWMTLNNEDIISMPDKWEYPWYAAWDLAFHCVPLARLDPDFAKGQMALFLREWYMRPNGQLPAYEWNFSDVNPPVHAWGCLQVYRIDKEQKGKGDIDFLKRVFQKLLINFTWWVNRKDHNDNNVFEGGFLGLDNIGVFDRSAEIPGGGHLEQADGTSWMAMYCLNMLDMALEIAEFDPTFEDMATKFFEHFTIIAESLNGIGEKYVGSWSEEEGFFYDILALPNGQNMPIKVRSLVGLTTLFATLVIDKKRLEHVPEFYRRLKWYRNYRIKNKSYIVIEELNDHDDILLSLIPQKRLQRMLQALLDEKEFFSKGGIRSLSKVHQNGYSININGQNFGLTYEPAESQTYLFGGNSNWRGPVWLPMNYLIIQSLREYHEHYGDELQVECPTGSGNYVNLKTAADEISRRLVGLFAADKKGRRPIHANDKKYMHDPHFKDLILFYEYFHAENGRGVGASHQTGWTGLVANLMEEVNN